MTTHKASQTCRELPSKMLHAPFERKLSYSGASRCQSPWWNVHAEQTDAAVPVYPRGRGRFNLIRKMLFGHKLFCVHLRQRDKLGIQRATLLIIRRRRVAASSTGNHIFLAYIASQYFLVCAGLVRKSARFLVKQAKKDVYREISFFWLWLVVSASSHLFFVLTAFQIISYQDCVTSRRIGGRSQGLFQPRFTLGQNIYFFILWLNCITYRWVSFQLTTVAGSAVDSFVGRLLRWSKHGVRPDTAQGRRVWIEKAFEWQLMLNQHIKGGGSP